VSEKWDVPRDPTRAIDWMLENAEKHAEARANVIQIENFMKSKRAILQKESGAKTASDREADALSHPDYIQLIHGLREAVYQEALLRTLLKAAELRVDVFRTLEASARREVRATQ
jgi:hypothetical protein